MRPGRKWGAALLHIFSGLCLSLVANPRTAAWYPQPFPQPQTSQYSPGWVVTEVPSVVAEGMEEGFVLGLGEVELQCRVEVEEFGGLEWEVGGSSEPAEPELG